MFDIELVQIAVKFGFLFFGEEGGDDDRGFDVAAEFSAQLFELRHQFGYLPFAAAGHEEHFFYIFVNTLFETRDDVKQRMSDILDGSVFGVVLLLKGQDRTEVIAGALEYRDALLLPCPGLRKDIVDDLFVRVGFFDLFCKGEVESR